MYSIIKIPKFEVFQTNAADQQSSTDFEEIVTVKWQQKLFSKTERAYYAQKENCKSELEKRYHQMIRESSGEASGDGGLIFTYTSEDNYQPADNFGPRDIKMTNLRMKVEASTVGDCDKSSEVLSKPNEVVVPSRYATDDKFAKMFVMADLDPTTLLITIYYRHSDGLFVIYPDFNDLENAYHLEIDQNSKQLYVYFIENLSETFSESAKRVAQKETLDRIHEETSELMKKLAISKDSSFVYPKFCRIVLLIEIIDGRDFEFDNIHVQFEIKLPTFVKLVEGKLVGSTHSSFKGEDRWNFGYCHSLVLDVDDEFMISTTLVDAIIFNFEVVSVDSMWKRERREGIASMKFPLFEKRRENITEVSCFRDLQGGSWLRDFLERFFLGGIHKSLMFDHNQSDVVNFYGNRTVSTGTLRVKLQKITQMQPTKRSLLNMKSIDEVISSYHKAKARLQN